MSKFLITFESQFYAVKSKKVLKANKIKFHLKPIPKELSNDCATCGIISDYKISDFKQFLQKYKHIYEVLDNNYKLVI